MWTLCLGRAWLEHANPGLPHGGRVLLWPGGWQRLSPTEFLRGTAPLPTARGMGRPGAQWQPHPHPVLSLPGLEYQRPKHQLSCDDIEVLSAGAPLPQESPELYRKGTTPSDLTPDDSPLQSLPASPAATPPPAPASRNKVAHFSRQLSVDEERGGDIQMLLEGRGGDTARGGTRGVRSGALRSGQPPEDLRARGSGHRQPGNNPKPRERRTESPPITWTSHHHRAGTPGSGGGKLAERDEEQLSNYKLEMKPLLRMHAYAEAHPQKRRGGRPEDRAFGVQRLRPGASNKENLRPASSAEPAVQKLESLRLGDGAEPRLLRWDLSFSPPQKSLPVALESDEDTGDELKPSTVSCRVLGSWGVCSRGRFASPHARGWWGLLMSSGGKPETPATPVIPGQELMVTSRDMRARKGPDGSNLLAVGVPA